MRTDRIIELINYILKNKKATSTELAEYFGVSTKSIYRDVEKLQDAGIPLIIKRGVNGGVSLREDFLINREKFTEDEEERLKLNLESIRTMPNAKLEYVIGMFRQYFNEAATMWVNSNDATVIMQEKFHRLKIATIERWFTTFEYYNGAEFESITAEPYELRIRDDKWSIVIYEEDKDDFRELYISRITNIRITDDKFTRRDLPDEFGKKYDGDEITVKFIISEITEELLNVVPIEAISDSGDEISVMLNVKDDSYLDGFRIKFKRIIDSEQIVEE